MKNISAILIFISFLFGTGYSQTNKLPDLVGMDVAARLVGEAFKEIETQVSEIISGGGEVDQALQYKFDLYKSVLDILVANHPGTTTADALASNSNYKGLTTDDQAYEEFIQGNWDENMTELIHLLTR